MRILFVLGELAPSSGANVNLVMSIAEQLAKEHELYALARQDRYLPIDEKKSTLFKKVQSFYDPEAGEINEFLNAPDNRWKSLSGIQRYVQIAKHPKILFYSLDFWLNECTLSYRRYKKEIELFCAENEVDAVIGASMPYYIARAVAEAKIRCVKSVLQMDPYTYNYALAPYLKRRRARTEKGTIRRLDVLFAATIAAKEIREKLLQGMPEQQKKVLDFEFPGIRAETLNPAEAEPEETSERENGKIVFAYSGQFYRDIRSPEGMLRIFEQLPENYELHLIGCGKDYTVEQHREKLGGRLITYGWMDSSEANKKLLAADFLVNLNNSIPNQLPSKLFQYINTGKPIINICKLSECPSLSYTKLYGNAVDVFEAEPESGAAEKICRFVETNRKVTVPKDRIRELFYKNTDEYAAEMIISGLKNKRTE